MTGQPQPRLYAEELILRPWDASDAEGVAAAYSDPGIQRWHTRAMTREEAAGWIAEAADGWAAGTMASWAVERAGGLAGRMTVRTDLEDGIGVIGYWVLPAFRGLAVAPRALGAATAWAFDLGLHRLELHHSTQNPASCRVAEKAGYALEGTLHSQALHADGWHDMHLHVRLEPGAPE